MSMIMLIPSQFRLRIDTDISLLIIESEQSQMFLRIVIPDTVLAITGYSIYSPMRR